MTRHALFRVLLSLLLLTTQHMATAHVLSHLSGSLERSGQGSELSATSGGQGAQELSSALVQEQSCHQCLGFAGLGGPLGVASFAFPLPQCDAIPVFGADVAAAHARTILAFHSRGPPQA